MAYTSIGSTLAPHTDIKYTPKFEAQHLLGRANERGSLQHVVTQGCKAMTVYATFLWWAQ